MADFEDPNLFNLLGDNVKLKKTEDPVQAEKDSKFVDNSLFVDEEHKAEDAHWNPLLVKVLTLVIVLIALAGLGTLGYGLWVTQPEQPPQMLIPIADRELSDEQQGILESKKLVKELRGVIEGYLQAPTIDEKLQHVRHKERVEPLMRDWYQKHELEPSELDPQMTLVPKILFGKSFWKAEMASPGIYKKQLWIQQYDDGSFGVDWETDVIYNPMAWDEFWAAKPTEAKTFRVYVGWNDLYLYQHRDEEEFQSFKLESRESDQIYTAYMARSDYGCQQMLYYILKNARVPNDISTSVTLPFLVSLKFDESPEGKKNLVVEKLLSPSWLVFE